MTAVLVALGAALMTVAGGVAALRAGRRRHLVLGLAAGLMLGVVGFELLPESLRQDRATWLSTPVPLVLFVGGFLLLHVVERACAVHRGQEDAYRGHGHGHATGTFAASALVGHSVLDGVALGVAFQVQTRIGVVVAVAVIAHDFADGFNTYTLTTLRGGDRRRGLLLLGADAVAPVVGAALSGVATVPEATLGGYLGFFAGVLMYLATADVLPEAHAQHSSGLTLASTVAGVALLFLIAGAAG
ncbi:ZIP family metal transporter [Modestobacter sp. NPDC049651]|uniref:ZIP family metal transporter n=1 Tax=unclassified Modestobacter TaxID=2643866 RepID=UPI0033CD8E5F